MSTTQQPAVTVTVTPTAAVEVKRFMEQEGVSEAQGGLRVSVQPGGCSGFRYGLLIEEQKADDDLVVAQEGFNVFVDPFSAQYLDGVTIDCFERQGWWCNVRKSNTEPLLRLNLEAKDERKLNMMLARIAPYLGTQVAH